MNAEQVNKIIRNRIRGSALIALLAAGGFLYGVWHQSLTLMVIMGLFCIPAIALCLINVRNYPDPRPSYQRFNKLFYVDFMRIVTIVGLFSASRNLIEADVTKNLENLGQAGLDAAGSGVTYSNMKRGEIVEAYFKQAVPPPKTAAKAAANASVEVSEPVIQASFQHTEPVEIKTPWIEVGLISAVVPTLLVFLLSAALLNNITSGGSTLLLYSAAFHLGTVLGPIIILGPYLLVICILVWSLSFVLKKVHASQPGMTAAVILLSATVIDIAVVKLDLSVAQSEIIVTVGGLLAGLGAVGLGQLPHGKMKKRIGYFVIFILVALLYYGPKLLIK